MRIGISMLCLGVVLWIFCFINRYQPQWLARPQPVVMRAAPVPALPPPAPPEPSPAPKRVKEAEPSISYLKLWEDNKAVRQSRQDLQRVVQQSKLAMYGPGFDSDYWTGTINYQVREYITRIDLVQEDIRRLQGDLESLRQYRVNYGGPTGEVVRGQQGLIDLKEKLRTQDIPYTQWVERQLADRIIASR